MSNLTSPLVNGFLLGIATGPLCMTTCFPVLLSVTLGESDSNRSLQSWLFMGKFVAGRFFAYLGVGLLVGFLGSRMGGLSRTIGTISWIVLAAILIAYGLGVSFGHLRMCAVASRFAKSRYFPLIIGALTGLNVCPPFLLAITFSLERSIDPSYGVVFFLAFFLATTIFIPPAGLVTYMPRRDIVSRIGKAAAVVAGIVFLYQGISVLVTG